MQNLMKRCATVFVLATVAVPVVTMPAMADRAGAKYNSHGHGAKVKAPKVKRHRHAIGHRFRKQDVIVVRDWRARGLPRPGRNEVYVVNGSDLYLATAATLVIRALLD
ncbi:Nickel/cobalt transporter regulator [Roseovarius lutimaris]|uniref:Nickel/cobalt transporter regulator n=1 Tax=Roseovarius lutimaris TaxID=1005928 RepID=A0A1I5BAQ5_9RHOB|nr:RcnB family protein [Roseovarius lutimaris]SFN71795.1 Nickel/cobalt transporter regulator [Roseovarius lutimaris]